MSQVKHNVTMEELVNRINELEAKIAELSTTKQKNVSQREMTDDDARRILYGDLKDTKHKIAAEQLGLSYGQIYSCRLEFTFKAIHKEMKEQGIKNPWTK